MAQPTAEGTPVGTSIQKQSRKYPCAAFNSAALALLAARAPLVEVGAGTGYWAAALRRRGVDVLAYDLNPPAADTAEANVYHGRHPPFTEVLRGGPKVRLQ
jgi:protein-L-isoaspartate O-methyltransferase